MSRFVDSIIAYRILRMLVTPFAETDAFKLGIIDERGRELKKMQQLNTVAERDAYTILHRMVFRLKKIIEKVPMENKKLLSFAAALSLIKENLERGDAPIDLENRFLEKLTEETPLIEEISVVNKFFTEKQLLTFRHFIEEAPPNNAFATLGIDGLTPETIGVRKKKKKPAVLRRNDLNLT